MCGNRQVEVAQSIAGPFEAGLSLSTARLIASFRRRLSSGATPPIAFGAAAAASTPADRDARSISATATCATERPLAESRRAGPQRLPHRASGGDRVGEYVLRGGATAISADGSAVVGSSQSGNGREAFRWTAAGGMEGLGDIDSARVHYFFSEAYDVSGDGRVVVGMGYAKNYEAFVWTAASGIQPLAKLLTQDYGLDLAGWHLTRAVGVSDDGFTFSGTGVNPSGKTEAWIATIPEPASAALVTLGCALLSAPRRRHG